MESVQSLLGQQSEVTSLVSDLLDSVHVGTFDDGTQLGDLYARCQTARNLGSLCDIYGNLSLSESVLANLRRAVETYEAHLNKRGLLDESQKQFLTEATASLDKLKK